MNHTKEFTIDDIKRIKPGSKEYNNLDITFRTKVNSFHILGRKPVSDKLKYFK